MPDAHHSVFATYLRYQIHCCGPTISRYNQIVNFNPMESEPSSSIQPCRHFEFLEILTATNNFDESLVIGKGGFGKVYKGSIIIESCLVLVAIKRLDFMSNQGPTEFWAEVEMLSNLRHCNLVYLIGHCNHENEKEMILVYEYMSNGTLYDHLHKLRTPVSWLQRLNICIGAGRGLHYLHTGTGIQYGVIHRDIKSSNILLHENWAAKISDFGLSKIGPTNQPSTYVNTNVKGTFGYLDPNYFTTGKLTRRSDVYAFGVVLLEVLCRKRAVDRTLDEEEWGLVTWAQDSIKEGNLKRIIDSDIRDEVSPKCLKEFVRIAERCLHYSPKQRPTMGEVVFTLESIMALQEKFTNSVQVAGRTLFSRMVDKLLFTSNGENSGDSKLSSSRNDKNKLPEMENAHTDSQSPSPSLKVFKSADLSMATRGFSQDLQGITGYFGEVFLGWVDQNTLAPSKEGVGIAVAVERLKQDSDALAEWLREANILGQLAHPNIIRLLGYCCDEFEHLLVYENLSNNSLDHLLFRNRAKPLSWSTRLSIMIGVARGLTCLHSIDCIHHELKSSTISLDEDFNAKLWGFRLKTYFIAETTISDPNFTTWVAGPDGYVAPEFFLTGCFTRKSDIYSFGIVLLESITGQKALDRNRSAKGQQSLVHWATLNQNNRRVLKTLIDPCLKSMKDPPKGAFKCFALALRCTVFKPKDRPSSEEILRSLEQIYAQYLQQTEGKL